MFITGGYRTVVHLMTEMLEFAVGRDDLRPDLRPRGMLLSSIAHLRYRRLEWRNVCLMVRNGI